MEMASGSKIRAFLALPLAPSFETEVSPLLEKLKGEYPQIRWVRASQIHVTLHFFGSVTTEAVETISKTVFPVTRETQPLSVSLSELGGFPHLTRPRVIWLGLAGEIEKLKVLRTSLERDLKKEGFEGEERPFKPHLTLGRIKEGKGLRDFRPLPFHPTETRMIREIVLFQSHLTPGGAVYEAIATYPLSVA